MEAVQVRHREALLPKALKNVEGTETTRSSALLITGLRQVWNCDCGLPLLWRYCVPICVFWGVKIGGVLSKGVCCTNPPADGAVTGLFSQVHLYHLRVLAEFCSHRANGA